jgi:hypothetical protein
VGAIDELQWTSTVHRRASDGEEVTEKIWNQEGAAGDYYG